MPDSARLQHAISAIDDANAHDPTIVTVRGRTGPKEILHAELVTEWVRALRPDADEALLLAARGHHFRRWTSPRSEAPAGRAGYLKWRKALHEQQARELGALLQSAGYDDVTIGRVQSLVRKEDLAHDTDAQAIEDALCLVFLETQLADVAARLDTDTLERVLAKTARKMSATGRAAIVDVPLSPGARRMLDDALAREVVRRYLTHMASGEWTEVRATLAPGVHRIGPYNDVYDGADAYATFLETTINALSGYELVVDRMTAADGVVAVELSETVDDRDERLHTDETVVFDVSGGLITRVAVYLRTSLRQTRPGT